MSKRKPVVAGKFYPLEKVEIEEQIKAALLNEYDDIKISLKDNNIIGGVVPHAGYMFSANQAVHFFEIVRQSKLKFDTVVIVNPNHTSFGHSIAFDSNLAWETPLGDLLVDVEFGDKLGFPVSEKEQLREHSGEVMLPFLQFFLDYDFKIAPITLSDQTYKNAKNLASKIFKTANKLNRNILLIASSDFSHFLSPQKGREMDQYVLKNILDLNSQNVEKEVVSRNISVCGYGPIMTLIEYSKLKNKSTKVNILKTGHSGEIIPSSEVVDYISILFSH